MAQVLNASLCKNRARIAPKMSRPCLLVFFNVVQYPRPTKQLKGELMKLFKRANMYKASNVSLHAETLEARSYEWWAFTKMIGGVLVFNAHRYSNSTCKHQSKVRTLLRELGHEISLTVDARCGLQDEAWPTHAVKSLESKIDAVNVQLNNTRRRKSLDSQRLELLNQLTTEKQALEAFIASNNLG
jgi:hypothetical protein